QARLRAKEQIVIDYFDLSFGINFRALQENVQKKIAIVSPPPTFAEVINGVNVREIVFRYDQLSADNKVRMTSAATAVAALPYGLTFDTNFNMVFVSPTQFQIQLVISQAGTAFQAFFDFEIEIASDGTSKFKAVADRGTGGGYNNAALIRAAIAPWHAYITSNTFEGKFANAAQTIGGFYM